VLDHLRRVAIPSWLDREAFPFESRFLTTRWGRVHYVDEGPRDGETVLLVHGTPSWSFEYRHVIRELARTRRVIACDHLGFGLSERPLDFAYTPDAHREVLRESIDALGLTRFGLVVHDFGGPIALPLAAAAPERITRLVVINSWLWRLTDDPELAKSARLAASRIGRFLYRWLNASLRLLMPYAYGDRKKLTSAIHAQYLAPFAARDACDARDARELVLWTLARSLSVPSRSSSELWEARAQLAKIPGLIVWGLGDRALPLRVLSRLRQALPQARVAELKGVGHWPQEEAPAELARLLDGFLPVEAEAAR
jgi:haloalkane dehalogenase